MIVNPQSGRDYEIHIECPEFTCLCPMTGQPDFATEVLQYVCRQQMRVRNLKGHADTLDRV